MSGHEDVRLEGGEAALFDFAPQIGHVVPRVYRRDAENVVVPDARAAAVRPVNADAFARRPPEQLDHADAERLRLNVDEGAVQPGDGFGGDAAGTLPRDAVHVLKAHLEGARVLADEQRLHVPNRPLDAVRRPAVAALAPAGDSLVRLDFDEHPRTPARVHDERINVGDFHGRYLLLISGRDLDRDNSICARMGGVAGRQPRRRLWKAGLQLSRTRLEMLGRIS